MKFKEAKVYIRQFMREHYSDERLSWLLAHAQSGRLSYNSCCCFIGIPNAPSAALATGIGGESHSSQHYNDVHGRPGYWEAERGFIHLGSGDRAKRRILIPMIRAEMKRREKLRVASVEPPADSRAGARMLSK